MGQVSKQVAIYISLFLCCSPFTMIATFYPQIAVSKGIPFWVIGLVFSLDPISSFFASMILGKYMMRISRKITIILSIILISISTFALSPIEYCDSDVFIVLSFISRMVAGLSRACVMNAADTTCISDYPGSIQLMIGRIEGVVGFATIVGPLIGAVLYLWILCYSLLIFSLLLLACTPIIWKLLETFRDYRVNNDKINYTLLMLKPVSTI